MKRIVPTIILMASLLGGSFTSTKVLAIDGYKKFKFGLDQSQVEKAHDCEWRTNQTP